jgi:predicted metal-dependent peptidase
MRAGIESDNRLKLEAARARLVLDHPFIGSLLLHLALQPSSRCESLATDGLRLFFNPAFIARLEPRHAQFMLAHQALHCALGHPWRRAHRSRKRWDIACDYAVNLLLLEDGMQAPPGALIETRYRGLAAEEIYPLIAEEDALRLSILDGHLFDAMAAGAGSMRINGEERAIDQLAAPDATSSPARSDDEAWDDAGSHARINASAGIADEPRVTDAALAQRWQMHLAMAAQQARRAGRLGYSWQRWLGRLLQPALPWQALLARYIASCAHEDYSFQRPARREGDALLPRLHSAQLELVVALDTSGSVSEEQLDLFAAEIDALKSQVLARVTLHACDERLAEGGPWIFQAWESIRTPPSISGGAGTSFRPVFEWVAAQHMRPDLLVYFTDAEGEFPDSPPPYPVLWLVKGSAGVPWGERIQLN